MKDSTQNEKNIVNEMMPSMSWKMLEDFVFFGDIIESSSTHQFESSSNYFRPFCGVWCAPRGFWPEKMEPRKSAQALGPFSICRRSRVKLLRQGRESHKMTGWDENSAEETRGFE